MALIALDELITPLTEEQVLERFLSILETYQVPARSWRKGGSLRTILRAVARTYSDLTKLMAAFIKSGFLEHAEGDWLTLLARYVYGVERKSATYATGQVTLTNTGGGLFPFGAEQLRLLKTVSSTVKKAYVNTEAFTLNPGETRTITVRAVEPGTTSNANVGEINAAATPMYSVGIANAEPILGIDAETDPELREACIDKLGTLSVGGVRGAYKFAASRATRPDGTPVNINRIFVSEESSIGVVDIFCASPSGAADPSDIGYVRDAVEEVARPDSVTANVAAATPVPVERSLVVWAKAAPGVTGDDIKASALAALATLSRTYPVGGERKPPATERYLFADNISGTAKAVHAAIFDVDGEGDDKLLEKNEVAVLVPTVEVRLVA